jgi:hypothetical protein
MLINLHAASHGTIFVRHSLPVNSRYNSWRCLPLGRYNTRSIRKLPVLRRRRLPAKPLCTVAAMNLSTEDSSSTNNIAIIFDCLYRFLKYGSSAQVRYVGGFFAAFVPSGLPAVLCGEWQAHEGRAQWREILLLSFKHAQHQNASSVSRRRDERSETLLDDGVERRVVRRKRHAPVDLDF